MDVIVKHFLDRNATNIKDLGTWEQVGQLYGITGNAAKKRWRRYQKKNLQAKPLPSNKPKILVFDLETAPLRAYVWRLWKQNVHPLNGQLQSEWFLLTYAAKWLFDDTVIAGKLTSKEVQEEDDSRLLHELWNLLNEADIVIAHNGRQFDVPILNGRFLKMNIKPPMPYKIIDTKTAASKHFNLPSNKLDYIAQYLGVGQKIETDFDLWVRCLNGNNAALNEMMIYNINDVKILEDVYLAMRPYIQPHPNLGLYIEDDVECCPCCTSTDISFEGKYVSYASTYSAFRCNSCGSIGRSKLSINRKANLTRSIPV